MKRSCGAMRLRPPSAYTQLMRPRAPSPSTCSPLSASFARALLANPTTFTAWRTRTKNDHTRAACVDGNSYSRFGLDGAMVIQDHSFQENFSTSRNAGILRNRRGGDAYPTEASAEFPHRAINRAAKDSLIGR